MCSCTIAYRNFDRLIVVHNAAFASTLDLGVQDLGVQANSFRIWIVANGKPERLDELFALLGQPLDRDKSAPDAQECLRLVKLFMEIDNSNDRRSLLELAERFARGNQL